MRTSVEECMRIGSFIASQLRERARDRDKICVILPVGGISMISTRGGVFEDNEADEALFGAIDEGLRETGIAVLRENKAINDDDFSKVIVAAIIRLM